MSREELDEEVGGNGIVFHVAVAAATAVSAGGRNVKDSLNNQAKADHVVGVMGIQTRVPDPTSPAFVPGHDREAILIRHAYVVTAWQGKGVGSTLLSVLTTSATSGAGAAPGANTSTGTTNTPTAVPSATASSPPVVMLGTWSASLRAIKFYEKHGFRLVEGPRVGAQGEVTNHAAGDGSSGSISEKDRLLRLFWFSDAAGMNSTDDPYRKKQMDASVVMRLS